MLAAAGAIAFAAFAQPVGAVYTMTNAANGNKVLRFGRAADGSLSGMQEFSTGRLGTGSGLGNQGGLILSPNLQHLFVVNAGSNSITAFALTANGLRHTDTFSSRGARPVSLAMHGNLLYVLNAGSDDIVGFTVSSNGTASPLAGSRAQLSGANTDPAQIQFNTQGDTLIVTEKSTNLIDTFPLDSNGRAGQRIESPAAGQTPFGFAVGPRNLIYVSEAFGGAAGASTLSSYRLPSTGSLRTVSPAVGTTQTAACWVVLGEGGRFAYTTNTGSGTISSYRVAFDGTLQLHDPQAAASGNTPIDMAVSANGRYLYVLNQASGTIVGYRIATNGSLTPIPGMVSSLPPTANGLAAH